MSTTVTSKGQITIPKKLRDRLGIKPGTSVDFQLASDGGLMLVVVSGDAGRRNRSRIAALRGSATVKMTTREIMALTRGGS